MKCMLNFPSIFADTKHVQLSCMSLRCLCVSQWLGMGLCACLTSRTSHRSSLVTQLLNRVACLLIIKMYCNEAIDDAS